ncbi:hypothetical protein KC344_g169 [Hortaea werneckii]|nr:hypothetical protein KC344_g169 [Hortaea werneckii]
MRHVVSATCILLGDGRRRASRPGFTMLIIWKLVMAAVRKRSDWKASWHSVTVAMRDTVLAVTAISVDFTTRRCLGHIPPNAPQDFRPPQGLSSAYDESQSSKDSQSMTRPPSRKQVPRYQQCHHQTPPTDPVSYQGQPSQSYNSGIMPQVPQPQMQGADSPLPQQQWQYQGPPRHNSTFMPQQDMHSTLDQARPPSELTSATSKEDSDSESGKSDDDENEDDEDEEDEEVIDAEEEGGEDDKYGVGDSPTASNHPAWPKQAEAPVIPPQQPKATSLASSLSGASKSTTRQSQPVVQSHPKAPSSVNSTLSGATGSTGFTADRSVRKENVLSRASSTVPTILSGATSKPPTASHHATWNQRQHTPIVREGSGSSENERTLPRQEHSLNSAHARPASLTLTSHCGAGHSSREHLYSPTGPKTFSNHDMHQLHYPHGLEDSISSSNSRGSQTSSRTKQRPRNQPFAGAAPPLPYPQAGNRGEADAYYDASQTFSSRHSAPSTRTSFRPNDNNVSHPGQPIPSSFSSPPPPPPPTPPPHGNQSLPAHPTNPPNATMPPNPINSPDPFAHSLPPGWKATLKGFARLYLHRGHASSPNPPPPPSAAEKYELYLRGERFFHHPVIRLCGNFRRRHYAVIAERVQEEEEGEEEEEEEEREGSEGRWGVAAGSKESREGRRVSTYGRRGVSVRRKREGER